MKHCIFIHTNEKQIIGALVSKYSFERFASNKALFDVKLVDTRDYPFFQAYEGKEYLRDGLQREWRNEDLQSFTVLRFAPPEEMGYQGRSVVVDPDVFCVSDVVPLLERDMGGKAIMARRRKGGSKDSDFASSVMLLDNARLKHWQLQNNFAEMFASKRDYAQWIALKLESEDTIGVLEPTWNDFDRLAPDTRLIHNTHRNTQPWKTGLPVDYRPPQKAGSLKPANIWHRVRRSLFGEYAFLGQYKKHPDPNQERLFFALLKECVEKGIVTRDMIEDQMTKNHVRHDALDVIARTPTLAERPLFAA
ncbi:MAG: hypothetical protein ACOZAM_21135 [Pseudomonadota bacterium]